MQNASKVSTSVLPQKLFHSTPVQNAPLALSAVGFDRGRDYKTLIEALRALGSRAAQHVHERLTYSHMWNSTKKPSKQEGG